MKTKLCLYHEIALPVFIESYVYFYITFNKNWHQKKKHIFHGSYGHILDLVCYHFTTIMFCYHFTVPSLYHSLHYCIIMLNDVYSSALPIKFIIHSNKDYAQCNIVSEV